MNRPKIEKGLQSSIIVLLLLTDDPISSRRLTALAGAGDNQNANTSSVLGKLVEAGLVKVSFGLDPDFPKTDRLYYPINRFNLAVRLSKVKHDPFGLRVL